MPFSGNHRTICAVLEDIRGLQQKLPSPIDQLQLEIWVTEAKTYAQSMSNRLMEHKRREDGHQPQLPTDWSGAPDPDDPDNFWIDDETGERVNAYTGERLPPNRK